MEWFEKIRSRRLERGMSQAALAKAVGVSQAAIDKIEQGKVQHTRKLTFIARELGIPLMELDVTLAELQGADIVPLGPIQTANNAAEDVPVYAAAEGGAGEMVVDKNPIDYVQRPEALKGITDGYIVLVAGDSMFPEYRPGEQLIIHPRLPPAPDTSCVFYTRDGANDRATVKHLMRITPDHWHVEQHNPHREFTLPRSEWPVCHRVVGKNNRR